MSWDAMIESKAEPKKVICTWSGGIDSTALIAQLLRKGWDVMAITLEFAPVLFARRERAAREMLEPALWEAAAVGGGAFEHHTTDGNWLWTFSPDDREIPRRNKHILDFLIMRYAWPLNIGNLGMGEYVGADTWLVRDHVAANDADARALSAYLYLEYGLRYQLWTLQDFGPSRYKHERLLLGFDAIGEAMADTTNCLANTLIHCGSCYKCVERAAAFRMAGQNDLSIYESDPTEHPKYESYLRQMAGEKASGGVGDFNAT